MLGTVRGRLGVARFEEATARGAVMGYDEAVALALEMCRRVLDSEALIPDGTKFK